MKGSGVRRMVVLALVVTMPGTAVAQAPALELSLDSLLNTRISAASKYEQTTAEAPASVTILTSDMLERRGYSRLGQVLEAVRGFYLTDDRNYSYLGTRGFSRPTDYNNRILVLIDGHTVNEHVWGGGPIGDDLPINLAAIERIEVIRGPGSALYGSSAMFAVINIVTRTGTSIDGVVVGARVGSAGHRQVTLVGGRPLGRDFEFSGSALVGQSEGDALYYPEYDDPETNNGRTFGTDGDRTASVLATIRWRDAAWRSGYVGRTKAIPTGAFEVTFNDPRTSRYDRYYWTELSLARTYRDRFRLSGRAYHDWYDYQGTYPDGDEPAFSDLGESRSVGAELLGVWDYSSRLRVTLGGEYRDVRRAYYAESFSDGSVSSDDAPFRLLSGYGQAEYQVSSQLTAVAGVRTEDHSRSSEATAPRGALIFTPSTSTTLKLLYGHAYRAPSAAEANIETSFYVRNPALRPERIRTLELAASHRPSAATLVTMSLYDYRLRNLIDQVEVTDVVRFENISNSRGRGVEFEILAKPAEDWQIMGSYAYQVATTQPEGTRLTNAPDHIAVLQATLRDLGGFQPGVMMRYESARGTMTGGTTDPFLRTDVHLGLPRSWGFDGGVRVTNLFDVAYASPVGLEHRQDQVLQPGRRVSVYGSWRY